MEFKEEKEVIELINHVKDINEQLIEKNAYKIRILIKDIQKTIKEETLIYEITEAKGDLSKLSLIDNIDINVLYNKIPMYRNLCIKKIVEVCGKDCAEKLLRKEKLL